MFKWINTLKECIKINKANKNNLKKFKTDMTNLSGNDDSVFNNFGLILSPDQTKISMIISLPENYAQYPDDKLINLKLQEYIRPVSKYLLYDLNWFEYIMPPELLHIEETDDEGNPQTIEEGKLMSLTYIAVWKWQPVEVPDKKWRHKIWGIIGTSICVLSAIITSLLLFI